ncbi:MAG: hypothetical protein ATN36_06025 [Epulopiscium sp. Nele67-Bin005]|nr:MAG: hypothetical protein ATN36_06025 [Epulopiscium sp. Nele67-Bin005]
MEDYRKAREKALNYISYCNRTEAQVRTKLKELEFESEIIESTINFLKEYDYINDEKFTTQFVENGLKYKGKSRRKLQQELYQKGIRTNIEVTEDIETAERETISKLLNKFKYSSELDKKEQDKIFSKITRKGFSYTQIKLIIETME